MASYGKNPIKRRKKVAIVTAQVLFSIGVDTINDEGDVLNALNGRADEISTYSGKVRPADLYNRIKEEGIDMLEMKQRLTRYWNTRERGRRRNERKSFNRLVSYASESLFFSEKKEVNSFEEAVESLKMSRYRGVDVFLDNSSIDHESIQFFLNKLDKARRDEFLKSINSSLAKKWKELSMGEELQAFLDEVGKKYKIGCDVIDFSAEGSAVGVKVEIGSVTILDWFDSLEEARRLLAHEIVIESKNGVNCRFCGQFYTKYSILNGDVVKCSCGARITVKAVMVSDHETDRINFTKRKDREPIAGFNALIEELAKNIKRDAIFTYVSQADSRSWDVRKLDDGTLFFGVNAIQNSEFPSDFVAELKRNGHTGGVLRSFTNLKDELTGFPIKELRGYFIFIEKERINFKQMSAYEMARANNTDSNTGSPIPLEKNVVYCGPGDDILDESLNRISKF